MTPDRDPGPARFFSLEEAQRTLPLVRRIVDDIMEQYAELEPLVERLGTLTVADRRGERGRELGEAVDRQKARLDELLAELHELGCRFKGFREGLVDWYSYYAGRPVFLCWKVGEPEIGWWHQIDAGFPGRQPILPSQRQAFRADRDPDHDAP